MHIECLFIYKPKFISAQLKVADAVIDTDANDDDATDFSFATFASAATFTLGVVASIICVCV